MKLRANEKMQIIKTVAISSKKPPMSIMALTDKQRIIIGFEVTVKNKTSIVLIGNQSYMTAWLKVYNLVKVLLK